MNNKLENFIIFSTPFHIKLFSEAQQIFIDGTFKSCPHNYYQILNIIISTKNNNNYFPLMHVLMSHKSYYLYKNLFIKIKQLLIDF